MKLPGRKGWQGAQAPFTRDQGPKSWSAQIRRCLVKQY